MSDRPLNTDPIEPIDDLAMPDGADGSANLEPSGTLPPHESLPALPQDATEPESELEPEPTTPDPDATQPSPAVAQTLSFPALAESPAPEAPKPAVSVTAEPRLRDVGATFAAWVRGRKTTFSQAAGAHRIAALVGGLVCVAVVALSFIVYRNFQTPPDDLVLSDARSRLVAPSPAASDYMADAPLALADVRIVGKRRDRARKEACDVQVEATFANDAIAATTDATLTYARAEGTWSCSAAATDSSTYHAVAGVGKEQVIAHLGNLLEAADNAGDGRESLASLYDGSNVEVVGEHFSEEKQVDSLTLRCTSATAFSSRSCDLTCRFAFDESTGAWSLSEALVSDGARDLSFEPLVGRWHGAFVEQSAYDGKCLSAQQYGLTLVIDQAVATSDGSAHIEGTVGCVIHLHRDLTADAVESPGDLQLLEAPFSGKLRTEPSKAILPDPFNWQNTTFDDAGIVFDCTVQDQAGGTAELTLGFGSAEDPNAATATMTSTFTYDDTLLMLIPITSEARFVDTFSLSKEG